MGMPLALLSLDDRTLAYHELRQDPAFPYLKHELYADYIDRSLAIGRAAAAAYSGHDPSELAKHLGVRIVYREAQLEIGGLSVHAEYDAGTRTITLCSHSMARMQAVLDDLQLRESLTTNNQQPTTALALHIAHELFHHIEETLIGRTDEQLPVVTAGRVGNLKWGVRRVQRCREIAAHSFAKALTGLPFLPNALDWLARFVR